MATLCKSVNQPGWLDLREQLWPHHPSAEHLAEMASFLASPERFAQFIEYDHSGNALGFVDVALRSDYVNGTNSSPVGFLEGIYVVPQARRQGIARMLVAEAERWATSVGCSEFASDAFIDNTRSHVMHAALGFEETERVVFFKKTLRSHRARLNSDIACDLQPDTSTAGQESTMTLHLDHLMVPSRNKIASAKLLAELLGVPWSETGVGPFAPVYVNDGLTFDFDEWTDPIPLIHYCFRVGQEDFNVILARIKAAGIPFRSNVHGPVDFQINTQHGGSIVYWNEPDGHQWEMLTVSYARQA